MDPQDPPPPPPAPTQTTFFTPTLSATTAPAQVAPGRVSVPRFMPGHVPTLTSSRPVGQGSPAGADTQVDQPLQDGFAADLGGATQQQSYKHTCSKNYKYIDLTLLHSQNLENVIF